MVQFECPRAIHPLITKSQKAASGTEFNMAAIKWMKVVATAMGKDKGGCNSDKVAAAIKLIAVVNRGEGGYGRGHGQI